MQKLLYKLILRNRDHEIGIYFRLDYGHCLEEYCFENLSDILFSVIINQGEQVGISLSKVLLGNVDSELRPEVNDEDKKYCNFLELTMLFTLGLVVIVKIIIVSLKIKLFITALRFEIL